MMSRSFLDRRMHLLPPEFPESTRVRYALAVSLSVLLAVRLLPALGVFQNGAVVLSSNDPYAYRHAVDLLLAGDGSPWDLPPGVARGEPLLVTTLWAVTALLGGSQLAGDLVLAWYPPVVAVLTGYLVYATAVRASDDPRVGLAAVVVLAVTPAYAYRTGLGFADHHAFDYLWLTLTAYALLVVLTRTRRDRKTWAYAGVLGVGIAGQLLAWDAGPLLAVPVGIAIAVTAPGFVHRVDRPLALVPVTAGIGAGAVVTLVAHAGLGWHSPVVPASAVLLFAGSLGVTVVTAILRRRGGTWGTLLLAEATVGITALALVWFVFPDVVAQLEGGVASLFRDSQIGEMSTLIEDYGVVFGPLIILGFGPFLALPGLVLGLGDTWRSGTPAWPVVAVYAGYFAALTLVQRRFGGELAPFLAILAGLGLVAFLAWLGVVRPPPQFSQVEKLRPDPPVEVPDRTRLALLGGTLSVLLGTGTLYTTLINRRLTIDSGAVRAAQWMQAYADERGWTYPRNFVLSEWGRNRMYNHVVNGESASYAYARQYYDQFLFGTDPESWYEQFEGRVGFVVTRDFEHVDGNVSRWMYTRLHEYLGSAAGGTPGLGNYRAVYASPDGEYKVFTLVPGATLTGAASDRVRVVTDVSIGGTTFEYVRTTEPDEDGTFEVTVAHPGTYRIGEREVTVEERDVRAGEAIAIND